MKNKPNVIIIDDDEDVVESITASLESNGIEVKGKGYNGYDADKLYQQIHPDFVLLDLKMPDYDGSYAIEKIKAQDPNAKIFLLTANVDRVYTKDEVNRVFIKPCDINQLILEIQQKY